MGDKLQPLLDGLGVLLQQGFLQLWPEGWTWVGDPRSSNLHRVGSQHLVSLYWDADMRYYADAADTSA